MAKPAARMRRPVSLMIKEHGLCHREYSKNARGAEFRDFDFRRAEKILPVVDFYGIFC